jgi:hypothetical protein
VMCSVSRLPLNWGEPLDILYVQIGHLKCDNVVSVFGVEVTFKYKEPRFGMSHT